VRPPFLRWSISSPDNKNGSQNPEGEQNKKPVVRIQHEKQNSENILESDCLEATSNLLEDYVSSLLTSGY
jgi:hypothetical protein